MVSIIEVHYKIKNSDIFGAVNCLLLVQFKGHL